MLFLDGADGDAETLGDFAVGKKFDFAQEKDGAATGRKFGDGGFEQGEFLARHDLFFNARSRRGGGVKVGGAGLDGRDAAALEPVDGEAAGGDVEQGLGLLGRGLADRGKDAKIGVVRDVLRLGGVAQ